ncbi:hypothetical protein Tco_0317068 [Tanacetum coccineum]
MVDQPQNQQQQDRPDKELVPITDQVRIGPSNFRITLEKPQHDVIYKLCLAILRQYSFFNAFVATVDAPEIYMQQLWHTVTYNLEAKTYLFTLDDRSFEVNAELLRQALQITPKVSDHPFVQPSLEDEIISFIKKLRYPKDPEQVSMMLDAVLGNLKVTNKGEKEPIFGMAILTEKMSDEIKASANYLNYLAKLMGTKPVKGKGKGLINKKGVEIVVEKIQNVRIPKKKHTEIVIEETGQSEEVTDTVDSKEIEDEEEDRLIQRRTGVVIGREAYKDSDEEDLDYSKKLKGVETMSDTAQFLLEMKQAKKAKVPDGLVGSSSSSSLESDDKIEDILSDDEKSKADDTEKADDSNKADAEKAKEEKDPVVQRTPLVDTVISMILEKTAQPPQSRRKTKVILKKSKQPDEKVDADAVLQRLIKLVKKVDRMSNIDHTNVVQPRIETIVRDVLKTTLITLYQLPSASADSLIEYELKLKLYNMMQNTNVQGNKDTKTIRHDKQAPPADADKDSKKRKRKDVDTSSSKKGKTQSKSSKAAKALTEPSAIDKAIEDEELSQYDAVNDA